MGVCGEEWRSLSVTTGPSSGGTTLKVAGDGFSTAPGAAYLCRFSAGPHVVDQPASATDSASLSCVTAAWNFPAGDAHFSVLRQGSELAFGGPAPRPRFAFSQVGLGLVSYARIPSVGCAGQCWPSTIKVQGAGFLAANSSSYTCNLVGARTGERLEQEMVAGAGQQLQKSVLVHSVSQLSCVFGSDIGAPIYSFQDFALEILFSGNVISWQPSADRVVNLREAWVSSSCEGGEECWGGLEGGTNVSIHGFGFDRSGLGVYECRFTRGTEMATAAATLLSPTEVMCVSPAWSGTEGLTEMYLYNVGDGEENQVAFEGTLVEERQFTYSSRWWLNSAQHGSVRGGVNISNVAPAGHDPSTPLLQIYGTGFSRDTVYYASFKGVDPDDNDVVTESERSQFVVVNSSLIQLQVPAFGGQEGAVEIDLWKCASPDSCTAVQFEKSKSYTFTYKAYFRDTWMPRLGNVVYNRSCAPAGPELCRAAATGGSDLGIIGAGFKVTRPKGYYTCMLSSKTNVSLYALSAPVTAVNSTYILCRTPDWAHGAGQVQVSLFSSLSGTLGPSVRSNSGVVMDAAISSLSPSSGASSGSVITVSGRGFPSDLECLIFVPNATGYAWLPDQLARVNATNVQDSKAICNLDDLWGDQYPGGTATVALSRQIAGLHLQSLVSAGSSTINFPLNSSADVAVVSLGSYVKINSEIMMVNKVLSNTSFSVARGQFGTTTARHPAGGDVAILLSPGVGSALHLYIFEPTFKILTQEVWASGPWLMNISIHGANATFLSSQHTLQGLDTAVDLLQASTSSTNEGMVDYPGVMFNIFANRSLRVNGFDVVSASAGSQRFWVFSRKRIGCDEKTLDCGLWGHELHFTEWELATPVEGINVTVDSSWQARVNFSSVSVHAGETLGFAIFGEGGIQYASSQNVSCSKGVKEDCFQWSDPFATILPGLLVFGTSNASELAAPFTFGQAWGSTASPRLFSGNVHYMNDEVVGDSYKCRVWVPSSSDWHDSLPTRAFSESFLHIPTSREMQCLFQDWPHPEGRLNVTVVGDSQGPMLPADRPGSSVVFVKAFVTAMSGPASSTTAGEGRFDIAGVGLDSQNHFCEFASSQGDTVTSQLVVTSVGNSTTAYCDVAPWTHGLPRSGKEETLVKVIRADGTAIDWVSGAYGIDFTVGSEGGTSCTGPTCQGDSGSSCLGYDCSYLDFNVATPPAIRLRYNEQLSNSLAPSMGPASGGTNVVLQGTGFNPESMYWCIFSRQADGVIVSGAVWQGGSSLTCRTPVGNASWGRFFSGVASTSDGGGEPASVDVFKLAGIANLSADLSAGSLDTTIISPLPNATINFALVGTEIVSVSNSSDGTSLQFVERGLLGSVDTDHSSGEGIFFLTAMSEYPESNPNTTFLFATSIAGVTPSSALADRAQNVTVSGFGFDVGLLHHLRFEDESGHTANSSSAYPMTSTKAVFETIPWPHSASITTMTMFMTTSASGDMPLCETGILSNCSRPGPNFTYVAVFTSLQPKEGVARGGMVLTLTGAGFSFNVSYQCTFHSLNNHSHSQSVEADVVSFSVIQCQAPYWDQPASSTRISVSMGDAAIEYHGEPGDDLFNFTEGWDSLVAASSFTAVGGDSFEIHGFGFEPTSEYFCVFDGVENTSATVVSFSRLRCTTPAWGLTRPASVMPTEVAILRDQALIDFTGGQPFSVTCNQTYSCSIEIVAAVSNVSASSDLAQGGASMTISGHGFDDSNGATTYFVSFTDGEMSTVNSSSVHADSTTEITIIVPPWPFAASTLRVLIYVDRSGQVDLVTMLHDVDFTFTAHWDAKDLTSAPTKGNLTFEVSGGGFNTSAPPDCVFVSLLSPDINVSTTSLVINSTSLMCRTPLWPYTPGSSRLVLEENQTIPFVGNVSGDLLLLYSGWDSITPQFAATGGGTISVSGYSFNESLQYQCVFKEISGANQIVQNASVLSSTLLSCVIPDWGSQYSAGRLSFSIVQKATEIRFTSNGDFYLPTSPCQSPGCYFDVDEMWTSLQVDAKNTLNMSASGASSIFVSGMGFSTLGEYFCVLQSAQLNVSTIPATPVSSIEIVCDAPLWDFRASQVVFSLYKLSTPNNISVHTSLSSLPVIEIFSEWTNVSSISSPSKGGLVLTVSGFGFDPARSYECVFSSPISTYQVKVPASFAHNSSMQFSCETSAWDLWLGGTLMGECGLTIELNGIVVFHEAATFAGIGSAFTFFPGWDMMTVEQDTFIPASGGSQITIFGYGFDITRSDYRVSFTSSAGLSASVQATAVSRTRLHASTPNWGLSKEATQVIISVAAGSQQISFTNASSSSVITSFENCGLASVCSLSFESVWEHISSSSGLPSGGQIINVTGFGMSPLSMLPAEYALEFSSSEGSAAGNCSFISFTLLSCIAPEWQFTPSSVNVSIMVEGSVLSKIGIPIRFIFTGQWISINQNTFMARGGQSVVLNGSGFDPSPGVSYSCEFVSSSDSSTSLTTVGQVSGNSVTCQSPAWNRYVESASLRLLRGSETVHFAGLAGVDLIDFVTGWDSADVSSGSAGGGETIMIRGFGFNRLQTYACNFSNSDDWMMGTISVLDSSRLECSTPVWGSMYEQATTVLNVVDGDGNVLDFYGGTTAAFAPDVEFEFKTGWTSDGTGPRQFHSAGGSDLIVSGFGFVSTVDYLCLFTAPSGQIFQSNVLTSGWRFDTLKNRQTAEYVSPNTLKCQTPLWASNSTEAATLDIVINDVQSSLEEMISSLIPKVGGETMYLQFTQGWYEVKPSPLPASEGSTVTVRGFGFNPAKVYTCLFETVGFSQTVTGSSALAGTDSQSVGDLRYFDVLCPFPRWTTLQRQVAISLLEGSKSGYIYVPHFNFSSTAGVTANASSMKSVQSRVTPDLGSIAPGFADRLGGTNGGLSPAVTITGGAFNPDYLYKVTFNDSSDTRSEVSNAVHAIDLFTIVVEPPAWDNTTLWNVYVATQIDVELFESMDDGVTWEALHRSSQATMSYVQINHEPGVEGIDWIVVEQDSGRTRVTPGQFQVYGGITVDGQEVVAERGQLVTVSVETTPASLFQSLPTISVDGTLEFEVANFRYGKAQIKVIAQDNGGTLNSGRDKRITTTGIMIVPKADLPVGGTLTIVEGEGTHLFVGYFQDNTVGPAESFSTVISIDVTVEHAEYFSETPRITSRNSSEVPSADLFFGTALGAFGVIPVYVNQTIYDEIQGTTTSSVATFNISIASSNTAPSFTISEQLNIDEVDQNARVALPKIATQILKGPDISDNGPLGEDWTESQQSITFHVVPLENETSSSLFGNVAISPSGTLELELSPGLGGSQLYNVTLVDDGGTDNNGQNVSETVTVNITVIHANRAPTFTIDCDADAAYGDMISCTPECASGPENCTIDVFVKQGCVNCPPAQMNGCPEGRLFYFNGIVASKSPSIGNLAVESDQQLEFSIDLTEDDVIDGDVESLFANHNGTLLLPVFNSSQDLSFCMSGNKYGNVSFSVVLKDDGGVDARGRDTSQPARLNIYVQQVNLAPSFTMDISESSQFILPGSTGHIPHFVSNILRGAIEDGIELESNQSIYFNISSSVPAFFDHLAININGNNGTLDFNVSSGATGNASVSVILMDDGQSNEYDKNESPVQTFEAFAVSAYVTMELIFTDPLPSFDGIRRLIVQAFANLSPPVSAQQITFPSENFFSGKRRLMSTTIQVILLTRSAEEAKSISTAACGSGATCTPGQGVNSSFFTFSNAGVRQFVERVADFTVDDTSLSESVIFEENATETQMNVSFAEFFINVTGPADVSLDRELNEIMMFDVRPLRHMLFGTSVWTADGTDGGLFLTNVSVTPVCSPKCTNATLNVGLRRPYYNGEVEFEAVMVGTDISRNFTVSVLPVNQAPTFHVVTYNNSFMERTDSSPSARVTWARALESVRGGQVSVPDEDAQNLTFSLTFLNGNQTIFETLPWIEMSGPTTADLIFDLRLDWSGFAIFDIQLQDDGAVSSMGRNTSITQQIRIDVLPINTRPTFDWSCSSWTEANCSFSCSSSDMAGCVVRIEVLENCADCPLSLGTTCAEFDSIVTGVNPSKSFSDDDEELQSVTFNVSIVSGNSQQFLSPPSISIGASSWNVTGNLSFCLAAGLNGETSFDVGLYDSGLTANGGINVHGFARLIIVVIPVNNEPSFNLTTNPVIVWSGSGSAVLNQFAIPTGEQLRVENDQALIFNVTASQDSIGSFVSVPDISPDGTLSFELSATFSGEAVMNVSSRDNGGSANGGIDIHGPVELKIWAVGSYARITLSMLSEPDVSNITVREEIRLSIAQALNYPISLVYFQYDDFVVGRQLLSTVDVVVWLLSLDVADSQALANDLCGNILGQACQPSGAFATALSAAGISVTSARAYRTLFENQPNFTIIGDIQILEGNETVLDVNVSGFIIDIVPSSASPLTPPPSTSLAEDIQFDVRPLRHRLFGTSVWTADGTDGGLFLTNASVTPVCSPKCTNATLNVGLRRPYYNGEVEFEAVMVGTDISRNFTVSVLPVNQAPTFQSMSVVEAYEGQEDVIINNFANDIWSGPQNVDILDEMDQELYFNITAVDGDELMFLVAPTIVISTQDRHTAKLQFSLRLGFDGNFSFQISLHDTGPVANGGTSVSLPALLNLHIQHKNKRPSFVIPNNRISVGQNVYSTDPYIGDAFVTNISAADGPFDESYQLLSFNVTVDDPTLFADLPNISSSGVLYFRTAEFKSGNARLTITLQDDGGTANFGADTSLPAEATIVVGQVNYPPYFVLPENNISLPQDSSVYSVQFATDVSPAEDITQRQFESDQTVTFKVVRIASEQPVINSVNVSETGILTLTLLEHAYGNESFELSLVDDGGGNNKSATQVVSVFVSRTNWPPSFVLPSNIIEVDERAPESTQAGIENFAQNISAEASWGVEDQNFAFVLTRISSNPENLFGDTPVSIDSNGTLSFSTSLFLYGEAHFEVYLEDDGFLLAPECNPLVVPAQGSCNRSLTQNFTIKVLSVNSAPSFDLSVDSLTMNESSVTKDYMFEHIAGNLSRGGLDEEAQIIWFTASVVSGPLGVLADIRVRCHSPDEGVCTAGTADLEFITIGSRFGNVTLMVTIHDSGGKERSGIDTFSRYIQVVVLPVNDAPSFRLEPTTFSLGQDVGCMKDKTDPDGTIFLSLRITGNTTLSFVAAGIVDLVGAGNLTAGLLSSLGLPYQFRWMNALYATGTQSYTGKLEATGCHIKTRWDQTHDMAFVQVLTSIYPNVTFVVDRNDSFCSFSRNVYEIPGFAKEVSLGLLEALVGAGRPCPEISWFDDDVRGCDQQVGTFVVVPENQTISDEILFENPRILYPCGTLLLLVRPDATGTASFNVSLIDRGATDGTTRASPSVAFTISTYGLNKRPDFKVPQIVEVVENVPFFETVATEISADGTQNNTEPTQRLTFHMSVADSSLFLPGEGQPFMFPNGTLRLSPAQDKFGETNASITLVDDGLGLGTNTSLTYQMLIRVVYTNQPPTFSVGDILVLQDSGFHSNKMFARDILPGPSNERCAISTASCKSQTVPRFVTDDISNPALFLSKPHLFNDGTVNFTIAPRVSGVTNVTVRAEDDGDYLTPHVNSSARHSFSIFVESRNYKPGFDLPWNISCQSLDTSGNLSSACSCPSLVGPLQPSPTCTLVDPNSISSTRIDSVISVLEDAGAQSIKGFVSHVTAAEGFLPGSLASFGSVEPAADTQFDGLWLNPFADKPGLEYMSDLAVSPDKRHVYSAEFETSTISVWSAGQSGQSPSTDIQFLDRMVEGGDRLRFVGFDDFPSIGSIPNAQPLGSVCGFETFDIQGKTFFAAASGCQTLKENREYLGNHTCNQADELLTGCDKQCCIDLLSAMSGDWDFSAKSMYGVQRVNNFTDKNISCTEAHCVLSRHRILSATCEEVADTRFGPATFSDNSGVLGAAVLVGPPCKAGTDWGGPDIENSLTADTFLVNNGIEEALQFDSKLNTGLHVAEDVDSILSLDLNSRLPLYRISVEAWFTIENGLFQTQGSGLVGVYQDEGLIGGCRKGWSVTYDFIPFSATTGLLTLKWAITIEANNDGDRGGWGINPLTGRDFSRIQYQVTVTVGEWYHIVATYDSRNVAVYFDGREVLKQRACDPSLFSCGAIVYPSTNFPNDRCILGQTPLTIGVADNVFGTETHPNHIGMLKQVRILGRGMEQREVSLLYSLLAPSIKSSSPSLVPSQEEYFSKNVGYRPRPPSPSIDYSMVRNSSQVLIQGRFRSSQGYRCKYLSRDLSGKLQTALSDSCNKKNCVGSWCDSLVCKTPVWKYGYKRVTVSVVHESNRPVRQMTCLLQICGYLIPLLRGSTSYWWLNPKTGLLDKGLHGSLTWHTFTTQSPVYTFNETSGVFINVADFSVQASSARCTYDSAAIPGSSQCVQYGRYGQRTCEGRGEDNPGATCTLRQDCGNFSTLSQNVTTECIQLDRFHVQGAASFTFFSAYGRKYLAAANFWDGFTSSVLSPFIEMTDAVNTSAIWRQSVPTNGARRWRHFTLGGAQYVFVANFRGNSMLYPFKDDLVPVDVENSLIVNSRGASSAETFVIGQDAYIAIACFFDEASISFKTKSLLYRVTSSTDSPSGVQTTLVQDFDTVAAHDVHHFVQGDMRYLAFALNSDEPSMLFAAPLQQNPPQFSLIQRLATTLATSFKVFTEGSTYMLVAQNGNQSLMLSWNGSQFVSDIDQFSPSNNLIGMQVIPTVSAQVLLTFSQGQGRYLVSGNFMDETGSQLVDIVVRKARRETFLGLDGPASIRVSPRDGRFVYVAACTLAPSPHSTVILSRAI